MMFVQDQCSQCNEEKTGVVVILFPGMKHVCLDCIVHTYQEELAEEEQDNEQLNEELGITFGRSE